MPPPPNLPPPQVTFLVAVNQTWDPCYAMGASLPVRANQPLRDGPVVQVGGCDSGPIAFNSTADPSGIVVTFASSIIEDAEPPQCTIKWAPGGKAPTLAYGLPAVFGQSPALPHCTIMDSREGYHLTQYTFAALGWE